MVCFNTCCFVRFVVLPGIYLKEQTFVSSEERIRLTVDNIYIQFSNEALPEWKKKKNERRELLRKGTHCPLTGSVRIWHVILTMLRSRKETYESTPPPFTHISHNVYASLYSVLSYIPPRPFFHRIAVLVATRLTSLATIALAWLTWARGDWRLKQ
jgi:hypothetical protein